MPGLDMNAGLGAGPAQLRAVAVAVPDPDFEEILAPLLRTTGYRISLTLSYEPIRLTLTYRIRLDKPIATFM